MTVGSSNSRARRGGVPPWRSSSTWSASTPPSAPIAASARHSASSTATSPPHQSLGGRSTRDWFAGVMASELQPLLHQYWFDASDQAARETERLQEGW